MRTRTVHRCGAALAVVIAAGAAAQCPSPQWLSGAGTSVGLQGTALATILWDPDGPGPAPERLVAGGNISAAGSYAANNIATFDPASGWQPMGAGLNSEVRALAIHSGSLYAAGVFGVSRWTGSAWESIGSLSNVDAIVSYGGQILAGGALGVMAWDGAAWNAFQGNVSSTFSQVPNPGRRVYALGVYGGNLIVGGHFAVAGSTPVNCLAQWNGSAWSSLGNGLYVPQFFNTAIRAVVRTFHVGSGTLYIGGAFEGTGSSLGPSASVSIQSPLIIGWNGSNYENLQGPCFSRWFECRTLEAVGGTLNAGGVVPYLPSCSGTNATFIARGPSGVWTAVGPPFGSSQNLLEYSGDLLLNGHTKWNNGEPIELSSGVNDAIAAFAEGDGSLYAVGPTSAGGESTGGVCRWDGAAWHSIGFTATGGPARVLAWYNNELYIGGDFTSADNLQTGGLVRYTGSTFSTVGGVVSGQVRSLAVFNNTLVVSGPITAFGPLNAANMARWDGAAWSTIGQGLSAAANALAVHNGELYAAGAFVAGNNILKLDNGTWALVPGGLTAPPAALASYNGSLYAGGTFTQAGSTLASRIASFNGSAWSDVGGGVDNSVLALYPLNGRLYAAGLFQHAGLATSSGIAQWNGSAWSAPDGGLAAGSTAACLGSFGDELVVGGPFSATSRGPSYRWARLGCPPGCYANCDDSTIAPVLNVQDFSCFLNRFAAGESYANCDASTTPPVLNVQDFTCFINTFASGCS